MIEVVESWKASKALDLLPHLLPPDQESRSRAAPRTLSDYPRPQSRGTGLSKELACLAFGAMERQGYGGLGWKLLAVLARLALFALPSRSQRETSING